MNKDFRTLQLAKPLYQQRKLLKVRGEVRDQLERATLSIYLNLAEGSGKISRKDQIRFYSIAMGSLRETQALLDLMDAKEQLKTADQVGGCLWNLIRSQRC